MRYLFITLFILLSNYSHAFLSNQSDFLPVDEAFRFELIKDIEPNTLVWQIAPEHYLYRDKLVVTDAKGQPVPIVFPEGIDHSDEFFGDTQVYRQRLQLPLNAEFEPPLQVTWQGCADAGLCYPPQTTQVADQPKPRDNKLSAPATTRPLAEDQSIAERLAGSGLAFNIVAFFMMGLLLAFTPCMLPMLPILTKVISGAKSTGWHRAKLGLAFVLPMALVYAALGVIAARLGSNLAASLQQAWLLIPFAGIFILLACAQLGLFTLQLPAFIRERLQSKDQTSQGGSVFGAASLGVLSALLVGPCMTAPLAGALLYIAQSGDSVRGGLALFSLGLGSGLPLLLAITVGMRWLPKPGHWMQSINQAFAYLLLAAAIFVLRPILSGPMLLALSAAWLLAIAVHLISIEQAKWRFARRYLGLLLGIWSSVMLLGAAAGGDNPWQPLGNLSLAANRQLQQSDSLRITDIQHLQQQLEQAKQDEKWVLLDFYADWCVSCKVMEKTVFAQTEVQQALADVRLLQIDVTLNSPEQQQFMQDLHIMGPPTMLFFDPQGIECRAQRVTGEVTAKAFINALNQAQKDS